MTIQVLIGCYFFGFFIAFYQAVKTYIILLGYDKKSTVFITGGKKPLEFLIYRVVFWPYYVCRYRSPLAYFSELLFSYYGEKGKTYSGTQGIKNFYRDIFKRSYYKALKPKRKLVSLSEESSMYQQALSAGVIKKNDLAYASVLYAKDSASYYLIGIGFCQNWRELSDQDISKYELYACNKLNEKNFTVVANTINDKLGLQLVSELSREVLGSNK